ncbi:hypothetical protein ABK040_000800 [Willaertia magna]
MNKRYNISTKERIERSINENLSLLKRSNREEFSEEFKILGTTDKTYTVKICKRPSCTCPDFKYRCFSKSFCKHILFVLIKVLSVNKYYLLRNEFNQSELNEILGYSAISSHSRILFLNNIIESKSLSSDDAISSNGDGEDVESSSQELEDCFKEFEKLSLK